MDPESCLRWIRKLGEERWLLPTVLRDSLESFVCIFYIAEWDVAAFIHLPAI